MKHISFDNLKSTFQTILSNNGFTEERAAACSDIFAQNSLEGVYSHGVNRFPYFVKMVKLGYINPQAIPVQSSTFGVLEQWDGKLGPGPLNALAMTDRAMEIANKNGLGCVALANTNHWMRAGYYGWYAAKAGFAFMAWTNTIPNMPAWGSVKPILGNNPIVMAVPYNDRAIVLDTAMSQFSYGKMFQHKLSQTPLPFPGGYDEQGQLTTDAAAILKSWSALPIGNWKGAGIALLLDILAVVLSGGLATHQIGAFEHEHKVSQVYIAFNLSTLPHSGSINELIQHIILDYKQTPPHNANDKIVYPGERAAHIREDNLKQGIPVDDKVWERVLDLSTESQT